MASFKTLDEYFPKKRENRRPAKKAQQQDNTPPSSADEREFINPDLLQLKGFDLNYTFGPAVGRIKTLTLNNP